MKIAVPTLAMILIVAWCVFGLAGRYASTQNASGVVHYTAPASTLSAAARTKVDFAADIKPILASRCQPCHFEGGTMYQRLPFDRADTIRTLGEKLFTRIKSEKEQQLIREFLAQPAN